MRERWRLEERLVATLDEAGRPVWCVGPFRPPASWLTYDPRLLSGVSGAAPLLEIRSDEAEFARDDEVALEALIQREPSLLRSPVLAVVLTQLSSLHATLALHGARLGEVGAVLVGARGRLAVLPGVEHRNAELSPAFPSHLPRFVQALRERAGDALSAEARAELDALERALWPLGVETPADRIQAALRPFGPLIPEGIRALAQAYARAVGQKPAPPPVVLGDLAQPAVTLPPTLARWRALLALFPPELQLSLGELTRRLARVVGPIAQSAPGEEGAPDGYRGLSRRGPFERLVPSALALFGAAPDEFLRRFAASEHLYWDLARETPGGERRAVVLFDAGPTMLGDPRIGALAALLMMAERASRAGVRFAWGGLQDTRRTLYADVSTGSLRRFLAQRTSALASTDDALDWERALGPIEAGDDLWIVGAEGLSGAFDQLPASRLTITRAEDARALVVRVKTRGRPEARVSLPLPPEDACVALLKGDEPAPARPGGARGADLAFQPPLRWFSRGRLIAGLRAGGFALLHLRNQPAQPVAEPVVVRPSADREIAAAGARDQRLVTLERAEGAWQLVTRGRRGGIAHVAPVHHALRPGHPWLDRAPNGDSFVTLDGDALIGLDLTGARQVLQHDVVQLWSRPRGVWVVVRGRAEFELRLLSRPPVTTELAVPLPGWSPSGLSPAFLGAIGEEARPGFGYAVRTEADVFRYLMELSVGGPPEHAVRVPEGHQPVALSVRYETGFPSRVRVWLVTIAPDRRRLVEHDPRRPRTHDLGRPILDAVPSAHAPVLAALTDDGAITVLRWEEQRIEVVERVGGAS